MKLLLVTFSDNSDHQDTLFGMYEELMRDKEIDVYLLAIKYPKVTVIKSNYTWLMDCPKRPGICTKTFDLVCLNKIIRRVKKEKFDAIYFESLHVWNLVLMCVVKRKAHIYHVIHEVIPHEGDKQVKQVEIMNKLIVWLADTIILRNRTYISTMIENYKISRDRVKFLELWRRYPAYTKPMYSKKVLFFGRINPYKGADNLLKIVQACPEIEFNVIGRVDSQMKKIVNLLSKEKNVNLSIGYVTDEEMKLAFVGCDWIIVPYNSASQSGIIIDAYKYSRPVIAFDVGAIAEQVDDNKSGFLVPAGDIDTFCNRLRYAINMKEDEYDLMSKQAYETGCKKYATSGKVDFFKKFVKETI